MSGGVGDRETERKADLARGIAAELCRVKAGWVHTVERVQAPQQLSCVG